MMNKIMEKFEGIERIATWIMWFVVGIVVSNVEYNLFERFFMSRSMTRWCENAYMARHIMTNLCNVFLVFAAISVIVTLVTYYKSKRVSLKEVES